MSDSRDPSELLEQLLMALVEGELTYVQQQQLAALLRDDPALQEKYRHYLLLDAALRWEGAEAACIPPGRAPRRRLFLGPAGALAAGLLLALALWPRPAEVPGLPDQGGVRTDNSVAVLLQAPGAVWDETDLPTRPGAALPPGRLRLKSGVAQIEFYSGAMVILEGPADFELISHTKAYCSRGKLRATVPPQAEGFTIGSPEVNLVDRGTEFGLRVGEGAKTEVHVFQGKVELYDPGPAPEPAPRQELTTGQGVRLNGPGAFAPIRSDATAFPTAQSLARLGRELVRQRRRQWDEASEALRRDPSVLVYYTFQPEPAWSRTLRDQARERREPRDGAVVGCSWGPGRWPGKLGLEFRGVSDRVRLRVPGRLDSVTLMAWVRVDALPNGNNALLLSDGWKEGDLHWQIGGTGTLILGVRAPAGRPNAHYHAPDALAPALFGTWTHLAAVYDRDGGLVTHYLDGRPVARSPVLFDVPLRVGDAEIGNWNVTSRPNNSHIRYLRGCMDEFLLFARALTGAEVEEFYARGRPPL